MLSLLFVCRQSKVLMEPLSLSEVLGQSFTITVICSYVSTFLHLHLSLTASPICSTKALPGAERFNAHHISHEEALLFAVIASYSRPVGLGLYTDSRPPSPISFGCSLIYLSDLYSLDRGAPD